MKKSIADQQSLGFRVETATGEIVPFVGLRVEKMWRKSDFICLPRGEAYQETIDLAFMHTADSPKSPEERRFDFRKPGFYRVYAEYGSGKEGHQEAGVSVSPLGFVLHQERIWVGIANSAPLEFELRAY
ncbi:MAG: hypothetical protein WC728_01640 [Elusimicrobiota bacterium]